MLEGNRLVEVKALERLDLRTFLEPPYRVRSLVDGLQIISFGLTKIDQVCAFDRRRAGTVDRR
jgi:hypothetical protein